MLERLEQAEKYLCYVNNADSDENIRFLELAIQEIIDGLKAKFPKEELVVMKCHICGCNHLENEQCPYCKVQ